jgi:hypothetical protein
MNAWDAYARFLKGSFMHVKRTNKRGVVINTTDTPITSANPARIPTFNSEQDTKEIDYTALMTTNEIWTRYTAPFHKSGDEPALNIDKVYRALWLPPNIRFEKIILGQERLKHSNLLYEAMPFSTSSSLDAAQKYLQRGALKSPGHVAYIFIFSLQPNMDAYIDARASYIAHTHTFNQAGFEADINDTENQLNKQKEITADAAAPVPDEHNDLIAKLDELEAELEALLALLVADAASTIKSHLATSALELIGVVPVDVCVVLQR